MEVHSTFDIKKDNPFITKSENFFEQIKSDKIDLFGESIIDEIDKCFKKKKEKAHKQVRNNRSTSVLGKRPRKEENEPATPHSIDKKKKIISTNAHVSEKLRINNNVPLQIRRNSLEEHKGLILQKYIPEEEERKTLIKDMIKMIIPTINKTIDTKLSASKFFKQQQVTKDKNQYINQTINPIKENDLKEMQKRLEESAIFKSIKESFKKTEVKRKDELIRIENYCKGLENILITHTNKLKILENLIMNKTEEQKSFSKTYTNESVRNVNENIDNLNSKYENKIKKIKEYNEKFLSEQEETVNEKIKSIMKILGEVKHKNEYLEYKINSDYNSLEIKINEDYNKLHTKYNNLDTKLKKKLPRN